MSLGWAVAMTQPNAERRAVSHLERQGYETYLPKFREVINIDGRRLSKSGVLFSRYVFVFIQDAWHSILGTIGVSTLIKNGERPAVVQENWITAMKTRADENGFIDLTQPLVARHLVGSEVSIVGGPFYGFKGIYAGMSAQQREIVLLDMLGRKVRVELDAEQIV